MKKILKPFIGILILGCTLMATSCFDIVEAVSKNGTQYHFYWRIAMANSMATVTGEEATSMFDSVDENQASLFPSASIKKFFNDFETGIEANFDVNRNEQDAELTKFLPTEKGNKFILPVSFSDEMNKSLSSMNDDNTQDAETKEIANILLASFKYRILIDKNILPNAKKAYFEKQRGGIQDIPLLDYGNNYSIEIPLVVFTKSDELKLNAIIIEKK